jgi:multidrug efflux pump subunit AcrA (membrane-fusion protein)
MRGKWVAGALAVVAAGGGVGAWVLRDEGVQRTSRTVATVSVGTGAVTAAVAATGTVQPAATRTLSFAVDGTVKAVGVRAGSRVAKGAVLASVDDSSASDAVDDAKESLSDAEDQLAAAKSAAAAAALAAATTGTTAATAAGAAAAAASAGGQGGGAAESAGGDAIFAAQKQVNQARYALAEARVALAGTTIKAPIAGTVMAVAGKVGTEVGKGVTFVTLADTSAMRVSAAFPEADAGSLAVGQNATVTLADRVGEKFAAAVVQVDPVGVADSTLVTYGVVLVFAKQPSGLLAGQSAAVEVTTDWVAEGLRVPSTAVHDAGAGKGTVRVSAAGGASVRRVGVGLRGDQYTQITSGLTAGELVVRSW